MTPFTPTIQFQGGGEIPVQYWVVIDSTEFFVHYRGGTLRVYANRGGLVGFTVDELRLELQIGDPYDGCWNARETNAYLTLIGESIESDCFEAASYPAKAEVRAHPYYRLGPLPTYPVGLLCGHSELPPPSNGRMNRHDRRRRSQQGVHDHRNQCYAHVSAQDVCKWIAAHPTEHHGLRVAFPDLWRRTAEDLELRE